MNNNLSTTISYEYTYYIPPSNNNATQFVACPNSIAENKILYVIICGYSTFIYDGKKIQPFAISFPQYTINVHEIITNNITTSAEISIGQGFYWNETGISVQNEYAMSNEMYRVFFYHI